MSTLQINVYVIAITFIIWDRPVVERVSYVVASEDDINDLSNENLFYDFIYCEFFRLSILVFRQNDLAASMSMDTLSEYCQIE